MSDEWTCGPLDSHIESNTLNIISCGLPMLCDNTDLAYHKLSRAHEEVVDRCLELILGTGSAVLSEFVIDYRKFTNERRNKHDEVSRAGR